MLVSAIMASTSCCLRSLRYLQSCRHGRLLSTVQRYSTSAAEKLAEPTPDGVERSYPVNITDIVDKIGKLTLMEVADLNDCLKKRLNIADAPMMPMGGMPMMNMAGLSAPAEEEEAESKQVQTLFTVKLEKFDDSKKIALIKEIKKVMSGMNLVQAKKFVESAPTTIKEEVTKDEAEELKKVLEAVGGTIEIE